jgi:hypothetical protein
VCPLLDIDNRTYCYQVSKLGNSKWILADALHKTWKPSHVIKLGDCEVDSDVLNNLSVIRFSVIQLLLYEKLTKHFLKWIPSKLCTTRTVEICNLLGYYPTYKALPGEFYKEIKENANDYDCWQSWRGENNSC